MFNDLKNIAESFAYLSVIHKNLLLKSVSIQRQTADYSYVLLDIPIGIRHVRWRKEVCEILVGIWKHVFHILINIRNLNKKNVEIHVEVMYIENENEYEFFLRWRNLKRKSEIENTR